MVYLQQCNTDFLSCVTVLMNNTDQICNYVGTVVTKVDTGLPYAVTSFHLASLCDLLVNDIILIIDVVELNYGDARLVFILLHGLEEGKKLIA